MLLGLPAAAVGVWLPGKAKATTARALSLGELVHGSRHALVATPRDVSCTWESIGGRSRIVTYSVMDVEHSIDGRPPDSGEVVVRTLGGRVDGIGQIVHGEALPRIDRAATYFLSPLGSAAFTVTGMAQGHYPLQVDPKGIRRLRASARLEELQGIEGSAVRLLDRRTLPEVESLIVRELEPDAR